MVDKKVISCVIFTSDGFDDGRGALSEVCIQCICILITGILKFTGKYRLCCPTARQSSSLLSLTPLYYFSACIYQFTDKKPETIRKIMA